MRESSVNTTLQQLRADGYKVKVQHSRWYTSKIGVPFVMDNATARRMREDGVDIQPNPKGGMVMVSIIPPTGTPAITATAACSHKENFVALRGTAIALGRAIDLLATNAQAD